jgi:hypothetical protein
MIWKKPQETAASSLFVIPAQAGMTMPLRILTTSAKIPASFRPPRIP